MAKQIVYADAETVVVSDGVVLGAIAPLAERASPLPAVLR
jgi:hypothetical protein